MNGAHYPRLQPGDTLSEVKAEFWNRLVDMAEEYDRTHGPGFTDPKKPPRFRQFHAIQVKNATEAYLGSGSVVALAGSVYDPAQSAQLNSFRRSPILIGGSPDVPADIGRFGVVVDPIGPDRIGWVAVDGVVSCKVDMDFQGRPYADLIGGDTAKLKGLEYGGAEILYIEDMNEDPEEWTAGVKEAIVRIGAFNAPDLIVSFSGPLGAGDSPVTANVHDAGGSSVRTISLYGSVAVSNDIDLLTIPPGFAFAKFHREAGVYELGMNTSVQMDAPPP